METKENLHEGHRNRLTQKFLASPSTFSEHELLEMLLFYALPRVDTNELAHKLIRVTGSINNVFSATIEQLTSVKGVGVKVATLISLVGELINRKKPAQKEPEHVYSFSTLRDQLISFYKKEYTEKFIIVALDKKYKKITQVLVEDGERFAISLELPEVLQVFTKFKPAFLIIAHNHPSGVALPSEQDDITTKKVSLLCDLHGVNLIEHIIVAGNEAYSYFKDGRLDKLKEDTSIEKIFKKIQ